MNIKSILTTIIGIFTIIGILWSSFMYFNSFATAKDVNEQFDKQDAKIEYNQLSVQEFRKENEIFFLQQRVWSKEDRINNCINCNDEIVQELKNDLRESQKNLESKEKELQDIKNIMDKKLDIIE